MKQSVFDLTDVTARFERKLVFEGVGHEGMLESVLMRVGFKQVYYRRSVNTVYFDRADLSYFQSAIDGDFYRYKPRLRWYGQLKKVSKPHFELKVKHGELGYKLMTDELRQAVVELVKKKVDHKGSLFDDGGIVSSLILGLPAKLRPFVDCTSPSLLVTYEREYFVDVGERVRATVDSQIGFGNLRQGTRVDWSKAKVVEFKYSGEEHEYLSKLVTHFPGRVTRMSKYALGVQATYA